MDSPAGQEPPLVSPCSPGGLRMKAACITAVVLIAIGVAAWASLSRRQSLLPAPTAPEAPHWVETDRTETPKPPAPKPEPKGATAAFPPSHDAPAYGLPLEFRMSGPDVPVEIAEPSPRFDATKPGAPKPPPAKKS